MPSTRLDFDRRSICPTARQATFGTIATALEQALSQVEDSLYQTKNRSGQDPLNYPIRLNNKIGALMGVVGSADGRPTRQSYTVLTDLSIQLDRELATMRKTLDIGLARINAMLKEAGLPIIVPKPVEVKTASPVAADEVTG